jgi:hypothetical protein
MRYAAHDRHIFQPSSKVSEVHAAIFQFSFLIWAWNSKYLPTFGSHFWGSWNEFHILLPFRLPPFGFHFQSNAILEGNAPRGLLLRQIDITICCLFHFHHIRCFSRFIEGWKIGIFRLLMLRDRAVELVSLTRSFQQRLETLALRNSAAKLPRWKITSEHKASVWGAPSPPRA